MRQLWLTMMLVLSLASLNARLSLAQGDKAEPPPKGEVKKYTFESSKLFPGTVRDYWVYVPRQYDASKPACVFICQDGVQYNAPDVFDRLIAAGEMPVTIGVFVMHGRVKAPNDQALDRFNRSYEYDGLGDSYARFVLDELLPDVEKRTAEDGRAIKLSKNGNDRCIAGASSGAICAFTAAWERPTEFSRVFSSIGTYVGLRGGERYSTLIRKYEPKPLRIFLEDGSGDQNIYAGDWWMANLAMERSLVFAGYEVNHSWGEGGHNAQHATEIFPEAMRWLWKDWPAGIKAGAGSPQLQEILNPGEEWKQVGESAKQNSNRGAGPHALATEQHGQVYFVDSTGNSFVIDKENLTTQVGEDRSFVAQVFDADGQLFAATKSELFTYKQNSGKAFAKQGAAAIVVSNEGRIFTAAKGADGSGTLTSFDSKGQGTTVDSAVNYQSLALSPDQTLLYAADADSHWVYSYQIQPDGSLKHRQRYYHLHVADEDDGSGASGMCVDRDGRLYVATRLGLQICDQAGRVNCIVPTPEVGATDVCFGGEKFDTIYCTAGGKIYSRKVKTIGAFGWQKPTKPGAPRL